MAKFKIGQRVKKVRLTSYDKAASNVNAGRFPLGTEGIVTYVGNTASATPNDLKVESAGRVLCTQADCWEPIQYDGNQKITWEACCWLPPHMRITEKEGAEA